MTTHPHTRGVARPSPQICSGWVTLLATYLSVKDFRAQVAPGYLQVVAAEQVVWQGVIVAKH